jgi:hypothetical protein
VLQQQLEMYDTYQRRVAECDKELQKHLAALSQLRTFFGFFALIFIVKAYVFIGALPESGRVETKCLPFDNGLLAICSGHVSAQQ